MDSNPFTNKNDDELFLLYASELVKMFPNSKWKLCESGNNTLRLQLVDEGEADGDN